MLIQNHDPDSVCVFNIKFIYSDEESCLFIIIIEHT